MQVDRKDSLGPMADVVQRKLIAVLNAHTRLQQENIAERETLTARIEHLIQAGAADCAILKARRDLADAAERHESAQALHHETEHKLERELFDLRARAGDRRVFA